MTARVATLLVLFAGTLPSLGAAQGSQPLRKTDVIRLLSNPLISKGEVADLIRRNCIAFRPTARDWSDLREFGADSQVLGSIGGCTTASFPARAPAQPPLTAGLLTERVAVPAGGTAVARIQVKRGDVPQAGIPLVLRGSARIPGGPAKDVQATTAAGGVAQFEFPVGLVPGTYQLAVATRSGFVFSETPSLEVVVEVVPPATVDVRPARVELRMDVVASAATGFVAGVGQHGLARTRLSEPLVFQARSSAGTPLAGKWVTFRAGNAEVAPDSAVTDSAGQAHVEVMLGKQAGRALVTASVDSVQKQATLAVEPTAAVSVVIEHDGMRVDGGTMTVAAGNPFRLRVSAQDAYSNAVASADLARMIQQMRNRFNGQSQLLKMTAVESDGAAALVTLRPTGIGQAELSIAGATVSVQVVAAR
jgi:hypothetical protein